MGASGPTARRIGEYEVLDLIGQGGMGVVYRAKDTTIGRTVAIKMLKGAFAGDPDLLKRFYREAQSTGKLQHKNIVTVYALGDHEGTPYLVIEYLDGESISQILASHRPMTMVEKLDLAVQVCDGLQYAHQRDLVHRDIKPANIIVTREGVAKIVDFGIARIGGSESLTQAGQLVGSMYYMSPEQINGLPVDGRSDIFSAAVMFYEMLTGYLPFQGADASVTFMKILRDPPPPLSAYLSDYPHELDRIFATALAKQVEDRYQSAEEFGFDLLQVQDNLKRSITIDLVRTAETEIQTGALEHARQLLQDILKLDRQNARANELLRSVRQTIQKNQRAAQIAQLRSQADVAFSAAHYEEALACAEQALRLDPNDTQSLQLRDHVRQTIARTQSIRDAISRAETSLYAGNLDEANAAVHEALKLDPDHTEAKALCTVVERDLAERARRQRIQKYVETARQNITERKFTDALASLHEAEALDPADSNIHELLRWANKGQEQEQRRKKFEEATSRIEEAMKQQDFASAIQMCALALGDFPDEPSLLRMKSLAEREAELLERRRFVQEQAMKARQLADEGKHDVVVERMFLALQRYPGEPNLQALLDTSSAALNHAREAEESAKRVEEERQSWMRAWQTLSELCGELHRALEEHSPVDSLTGVVHKLNELVPTMTADDDARKLALPLLLEYETRRNARDKAWHELDQLARTRFTPETSFDEIEKRVHELVTPWPHDTKIESLAKRLNKWINEFKTARAQEAAKAAAVAAATPPSAPEAPSTIAAAATPAREAAPVPEPAPVAIAPAAAAEPPTLATPRPVAAVIGRTTEITPPPSAPVAKEPAPIETPRAPEPAEVLAPEPARSPILWIAIAAALVIAVAALAVWKFTRPAPLVEIRAESNPPGALVHLGDQTCTTPCALRVKRGTYTASAQLTGYNSSEQTITATSNTTASFALTAAPVASTPAAPTPAPETTPTPTPTTAPPAENATATPAPVSERDAWLAVKDSRNIVEVRRFVQRYPRGVYQSQAKAKLEDMVWNSALSLHTPAAIQAYLHEYPTGFYAAEANVQLSRLEWDSQALQNSNDIARLQDFAHRYPAGEYHDRALARIDDIHWAEVRPNDAATLHAYLDRSPNGRHAAEAHAALDRIERAAQAAAKPISNDSPEKAALKSVLAAFDRAYRAKDFAALQRVWPNAKKSKEIGPLFQSTATIEIATTLLGEPSVKGNKAEAKCSQSINITAGGEVKQIGGPVTIRFKQSGGTWQIDNIR